MNTEKRIGKITSAAFGRGGYQDACIGLSLSFGSANGWGVSTFIGGWDTSIEVNERTKWTEADRDREYAKAVRVLSKTLKEANRDCVSRLAGTPVEITFECGTLKDWRVLTEVI